MKSVSLFALCCLFAGSALAQPVPVGTTAPGSNNDDEWLVVAAGQAGGQNNSFGTVGVVAPLPGSKLGKGWVTRVFADEVSYRFRGGNPAQKVDALGLGGSVTVGYMDSDDNGWWGVYAGPAYRHVSLSPHVQGTEAGGGTVSARVQLEGERNLTQDSKVNLLAGTDISSNTGYWTRARALQRVEGDVYAGPEAYFLGDQDYSAYQVGVAVVGMHITDKTQVGASAGYRKVESESGAAYGGLELGSRF